MIEHSFDHHLRAQIFVQSLFPPFPPFSPHTPSRLTRTLSLLQNIPKHTRPPFPTPKRHRAFLLRNLYAFSRFFPLFLTFSSFPPNFLHPLPPSPPTSLSLLSLLFDSLFLLKRPSSPSKPPKPHQTSLIPNPSFLILPGPFISSHFYTRWTHHVLQKRASGGA